MRALLARTSLLAIITAARFLRSYKALTFRSRRRWADIWITDDYDRSAVINNTRSHSDQVDGVVSTTLNYDFYERSITPFSSQTSPDVRQRQIMLLTDSLQSVQPLWFSFEILYNSQITLFCVIYRYFLYNASYFQKSTCNWTSCADGQIEWFPSRNIRVGTSLNIHACKSSKRP